MYSFEDRQLKQLAREFCETGQLDLTAEGMPEAACAEPCEIAPGQVSRTAGGPWPADYGANNNIFTRADAEAALARLKATLAR